MYDTKKKKTFKSPATEHYNVILLTISSETMGFTSQHLFFLWLVSAMKVVVTLQTRQTNNPYIEFLESAGELTSLPKFPGLFFVAPTFRGSLTFRGGGVPLVVVAISSSFYLDCLLLLSMLSLL